MGTFESSDADVHEIGLLMTGGTGGRCRADAAPALDRPLGRRQRDDACRLRDAAAP